MAFIRVRHNMEVAHRLRDLKGKCEAIHGHSMWVELTLHGVVNGKGLLDDLEFGDVKRQFRLHLDGTYDHRLLLNERDPWAAKLYDQATEGMGGAEGYLPGLQVVKGDPTTENIARWVAKWASDTFNKSVDVVVHETAVNAAGYSIR